MSDEISLRINGRKVKGREGQTILEVAQDNGIWIPTLCHDPRLEPYGACRICLVDVKGARGLMPSCITAAEDGMVVRTETPEVNRIRRTIIGLLLSDHPRDCLTCESAGNCTLQELAYHYGVKADMYLGEEHHYEYEDVNPFIVRDLNKCILCGRCVRICEQMVGKGVYGFVDRGFDTIVSTPYDASLLDSPCVFCGQCISTCPVGALTSKMSEGLGRFWDLERVDTVCPYCGCGCVLSLWVKDGEIVEVTAPMDKGSNRGSLCIKGRFGFEYVSHPDRLKYPLIRKKGKLERVSWRKAIDYVAEKLTELKEEHGPDAIGFLSSARCTNEENYVMQKFARAVVGTNNVDHCARL